MTLSDEQVALLKSKGLSFIADEIAQQNDDTNAMWQILTAMLVFFMQTGFAMLCAGFVRAKNTKNILLKNILDACVGALGFWSIGYGVAYGMKDGGNSFVGNTFFFLTEYEGRAKYESFLFQFAFAATGASIVSGAVAERTKFAAYIWYSLFLTMWVYPVVVHWVWCPAGWLTAFRPDALLGTGLIDFAGSGVVHLTGAWSALIGAHVCGQRIGRYNANGELVDMPGHSAALQVLGTLVLWVGWYGFNPGSTLAITGGLGEVAAKAAVNTTLAAAAGAVGSVFIWRMATGRFDLSQTLNGLLCGLVSITAGCAVVEPWAAVIIGAIASIIYALLSEFVKRKLKIDDVVDAFAVHGGGGSWGLIAASLFCRQENYVKAYGASLDQPYGAFYAPLGKGHQMFVCALVGISVITLWTVGLMYPFFKALSFMDWLRVPAEEEEVGMDVSKHGGSAYPDHIVLASDVSTSKNR